MNPSPPLSFIHLAPIQCHAGLLNLRERKTLSNTSGQLMCGQKGKDIIYDLLRGPIAVEAGEIDSVWNLLDRIKSIQRKNSAQNPCAAHHTAFFNTLQGIMQCPGPHQLQRLCHTGKFARQSACIQHSKVSCIEQRKFLLFMGGGNHSAPQGLGDLNSRISQGAGAAAHQKRIICPQIQPFKQRTPSGEVCPGTAAN